MRCQSNEEILRLRCSTGKTLSKRIVFFIEAETVDILIELCTQLLNTHTISAIRRNQHVLSWICTNSAEVVRTADKAIGRHTKKQNKPCEYNTVIKKWTRRL